MDHEHEFVPDDDEPVEHKPNGGGPEPRFKLVRFSQIRPRKRAGHLIRDVIPRAGIVIVWGSPKCGKTFWVYDLVMYCARSIPEYRGRHVIAGPVVYCAFEGQEGFRRRVEAYRREHGIDDEAEFFLITADAKLVRDHKVLIDDIRGQVEAPVVVVLDTLNRSIDGSESRDQDMGAYLDAADAIHQAFECVVLIVHHCGIDGSRPRGHTSITGTCEAQIVVKKDSAGNVVAEVEYMKDGASGARFTSRLKVVETGFNEFGLPESSCVIEEADESMVPAKKKVAKLTDASIIARRALAEAILDAGQPAPLAANAPPNTRGVDVAVWRKQAYLRGIAGGATERAKQQAFKRSYEQLVKLSQVGVWDDFVWLAVDGG